LDDAMHRRLLLIRDQPELDQAPSQAGVGGAGRSRNIGKHRPGLDRRQLIGVADQHQACARAYGIEQPRHHRERDHRHLIHDHDIMR
jgi:hypothetical protein